MDLRLRWMGLPLAGLGLMAVSPAWADVVLTDLAGVAATANACRGGLPPCSAPWPHSAAAAIDHRRYDPLSGDGAWDAGTVGSVIAPNWLRVDLGEVYTISSVTLEFIGTEPGNAGLNNLYRLRYSADGSLWGSLGSGSLSDSGDSQHPEAHHRKWTDADAPQARWVEYDVLGGSYNSALGEMIVTGASPIFGVPEPDSQFLFCAGLLALHICMRRSKT